MFDFLQKGTEINTTQIVDEIEAAVYVHVRPYGFKKYGRTLHRFVSEDISQVIHFQSGMPAHGMGGLLCVNVGIRIPECSDRVFQPKAEKKNTITIMTAPFAPAWERSVVNKKPGHNNGLTGICPAQIRLHTAVLLFGHDAQKLTLFL